MRAGVLLVALAVCGAVCMDVVWGDEQVQANSLTINMTHTPNCSAKFINLILVPYLGTEGEVPSAATTTEAPEEDDDLTSFAEFKEKIIQSIEPSFESEPRPANGPSLTRNYASVECGAKVISTNSGAKNPSAMLNSNKDQYLMNDCSNDIFFIVELCELISVRTIVMGSLELFSSIPKSFRVLASERYEHEGSQPNEDDWTLIGSFAAANERSEQSFPLSSEGQVYAKYIMVVMENHYGQERVCPINTFKVIGASMIEVYEESEQEGVVSPPTTNVIPPADGDGLSEDLSLLETAGGNGEDSEYNGTLLSAAKDAVYRILEQPLELLGTVIKPDGKSTNGEESTEHAQIEQDGLPEEGPGEDEVIDQLIESDSSESDPESISEKPTENEEPSLSVDTNSDVPVEPSEVTEDTHSDKLEDAPVDQDSSNGGANDSNETLETVPEELLGPTLSHDQSHDLLGPVEQDLATTEATNVAENDNVLSMPTPSPEAIEPPLEAPPTQQKSPSEENTSEAVAMATEADKPMSINRTSNSTLTDNISIDKNNNSSNITSNKVGVAKNETGELTNGNGAHPAPRDKEKSVFLRLSNQIKELQVNMTLFSSYLDQISATLKRSKNRTNETTHSLDRRLTALNETMTRLQNETNIKISLLENLSEELVSLSTAVVNSTMEMTTFDNKVFLSLLLLIVLQCIVVFPLICLHWLLTKRQQQDLQTQIQSLKLAIEAINRSTEQPRNGVLPCKHNFIIDNSSDLSTSCSLPFLQVEDSSHDSHEWQIAEGRHRKKNKYKSRQ